MTSKDSGFNGYTSRYGKHFDPIKCSISNSWTKNLDQHRMSFYVNGRTPGDSQLLLSTGSPMSDEYYSSNELSSGEILLHSDFQQSRQQYPQPICSDIDWNLTYNSPVTVGCLADPTFNMSFLGVGEQPASVAGASHFAGELPMELLPEEYRSFLLPRCTDMWSRPPSPIFQTSPSPIDDCFFDPKGVISKPMNIAAIVGQEGGGELVIKTFDESKDGSFLFVTTNNVEELRVIFRERGLEVQDIGKTRTPGVLVVLFKTHEIAKRAFTTQQEIGMRMVPPTFTKRYWFKNPSPKFHVMFETTRRLTIKSGKSSSNVKVGDFLMMDAKMGRGCIVLADQMKGHRMRVVGYIGKFMNIDGLITEQKYISQRKMVGWISTQCHKTKEKFVMRKSMNEIKDYVYDGAIAVDDEMIAVE